MKKGSFELMKRINQQLILKTIYIKKSISRVEIAEITNLSRATVSNIVKDLLEMNLIRESMRGESRGGRKPILLELNPSGAYVIGLEWGVAEIKGVLLDLNKRIVDSKKIPVSSCKVENFIDDTIEIINYLSKRVDNPEKIFGVGIGIHGLVDPQKGISLYAPHFRWENVLIREYLEQKIDYHVLLDNDVRMMATAEEGEGKDNFVFINTGPGIGAAIVFEKKLLFGTDCSAGEFGHMTIVDDGPLCSCGNHGCLEALISLNQLVKRYNPSLSSDLSYPQLREEWTKLLNAAKEGQKEASKILIDAGKYLGTGIADLVNLLNPEAIIIGGAFLEAEEFLFPVIRQQVKKKALKIPAQKLEIIPTAFGEKVGAIGAATRVLQDLFKLEKKN